MADRNLRAMNADLKATPSMSATNKALLVAMAPHYITSSEMDFVSNLTLVTRRTPAIIAYLKEVYHKYHTYHGARDDDGGLEQHKGEPGHWENTNRGRFWMPDNFTLRYVDDFVVGKYYQRWYGGDITDLGQLKAIELTGRVYDQDIELTFELNGSTYTHTVDGYYRETYVSGARTKPAARS